MENREYYCDCKEKCSGIRRKVGRTTFFTHRKYRDPLCQFSSSMQTFLKDHPIIVDPQSSRAEQSSRVRAAGPSDENTCPTIGPPNKRMRQSGDNTSHAVGARFWGHTQRS